MHEKKTCYLPMLNEVRFFNGPSDKVKPKPWKVTPDKKFKTTSKMV